MTDASASPPPAGKQPLDIGKVIGDVFGLYFKTLPVFFVIVFVPYFFFDLFLNQSLQRTIQDSIATGEFEALSFGITIAAAVIPFILGFVFLQAVMIYMAVSMRMGQGYALGRAIAAALRGLIPIIGITLLFLLIVFAIYGAIFGMIWTNPDLVWLLFAIVPAFMVVALIVAAMFYVYMPAIVFENAGFGALGRSLELTRGYRGAIIGQMILLFFILLMVSMVLGLIIGAVSVAFLAQNLDGMSQSTEFVLPWWYSLINAGVNGLSLPISLIPPAIVYTRLREIKEGGEADILRTVFD
ncbi:hypothetical protein [Hyphobacterium sp.]|uniref:hypothetical protein n=1 Tax=Hyphobacterium sp. TaxID=2004662 RepID=UPI003BAA5EAA